jgi:transloator
MNSSTITTSNPYVQQPTTHTPGTNQTGATTQTTPTGVVGQSGPTPDASGAKYQTAAIPFALNAMLESLTEMMGPNAKSDDDLDAKVASLEENLKNKLSQSDASQIQNDQAEQTAKIEAKAQKDQQAEQKIKDAVAKQQSASIWDKIKLAFEVIGAVLGCVVAGVLIATGVGTAAGIALAIGAAAGLMLAIDDVVKETTPDHLGIAGSIAHDSGEPLDYCQKCDMGFDIALAGIAAITSVVALVNPAGIFSAGAKLSAEATEVASQISKGAEIAQGVNDIGTATTTVGSGVTNYQATTDQADAQGLQAQSKLLQAVINTLDDSVDIAIKALEAKAKTFAAVIQTVAQSAQDTANTIDEMGRMFKG